MATVLIVDMLRCNEVEGIEGLCQLIFGEIVFHSIYFLDKVVNGLR